MMYQEGTYIAHLFTKEVFTELEKKNNDLIKFRIHCETKSTDPQLMIFHPILNFTALP